VPDQITRLRIVLLGLCLSLLILAGSMYIAQLGRHNQSKFVPADQLELLSRNYGTFYQSLERVPFGSSNVDPTHHFATVSALLIRQGISVSKLTKAEMQFLGNIKSVDGSLNSYDDIIRLCRDFVVVQNRPPDNAAELAIADGNPDDFIERHPCLINPATGRLFGSFKESSGPLALTLTPGTIDRMKEVGNIKNVWQSWHLVVKREDGKHTLIETDLMF